MEGFDITIQLTPRLECSPAPRTSITVGISTFRGELLSRGGNVRTSPSTSGDLVMHSSLVLDEGIADQVLGGRAQYLEGYEDESRTLSPPSSTPRLSVSVTCPNLGSERTLSSWETGSTCSMDARSIPRHYAFALRRVHDEMSWRRNRGSLSTWGHWCQTVWVATGTDARRLSRTRCEVVDSLTERSNCASLSGWDMGGCRVH